VKRMKVGKCRLGEDGYYRRKYEKILKN